MTEATQEQIEQEHNEIEAARAYREYVAEIRRLQQRVDDVTRRASINVAAVRRALESRMQQWAPFLKGYAIDNAKVNKKTGEKKKSYIDDEVGAGVFFATRKGTVKALDPSSLRPILVGLGISGAVTEKITYELDYQKIKKGLDEAFIVKAEQEVINTQGECPDLSPAKENWWALVESRKKFLIAKWCERNGVTLTHDDPYGYMYVGCDRGWTATNAKKQLCVAIDGKLEITDEDIEEE